MMLSDMFLNQPVNDTPTQISMALQTTKIIDQDAAEIYEEFLERAKVAETVCRESGIQILGQYKLTDALPTNLNPDESTDTLLLIFQFYAKIKTASSHATFAAAEDDVNFMSFSKVEIFCRDFKVTPRLLTREELKMLWGDIARAHVLAGRGVFTVIDFDEFKDLIIRMALWAYHKPGLKKLIITLEGFMPRNAEILQSFCHYLKLPDVQFINNFIRTKGRQTQGELNYRSKGETNLRTRMEVRADTDARKLSQTSSGNSSSSNKASLSQTPGKGKKMNIYGELEYEERHLRGANPKRVVRPSTSASAGASTLALSLSPVKTPPFSPNGTKSSLNNSIGGINNKNPNSASKPSLIPASLLEKLQPMDSAALLLLLKKVGGDDQGDNGDDLDDGFNLDSNPSTPRNNASKSSSKKSNNAKKNDDDESDDDEELSRPSRFKNKPNYTIKKTNSAVFLKKPVYRFVTPDEAGGDYQDDDDDDDNLSVTSSVLPVFHDSSLDALRAAYDADYDARLAKQELFRYCYMPPVPHSTAFLPTKGPMIDLGLLQSGAKVTIQFRVTNGAGDDIFLDSSARDFHATDTHISTYSKMLIPGMSRHVCVTFTVPSHNCRVLGSVDVVCLAPRHTEILSQSTAVSHLRHTNTNTNTARSSGTKGRCVISCPVFYRVDCVAHRDIYPVCVAGSLRPLYSRSSRRSAGSPTNNNVLTLNNTANNSRLNTANTNNTNFSANSTNNNNYANSNNSKVNVNNVIVNSRLGAAAGIHRSDWDVTFQTQRVESSGTQQPHSNNNNNNNLNVSFSRPRTSEGFPLSPSSPSATAGGGGGGALERWPSGRFTTLTELPATRTAQQVPTAISHNHQRHASFNTNINTTMGSNNNNSNSNFNPATTAALVLGASAGSSPFVPRTADKQKTVPRPSSPVPGSVPGALSLSAQLQFQRTNSSQNMNYGSNNVGGGTSSRQNSKQRLLDNLNQTF